MTTTATWRHKVIGTRPNHKFNGQARPLTYTTAGFYTELANGEYAPSTRRGKPTSDDRYETIDAALKAAASQINSQHPAATLHEVPGTDGEYLYQGYGVSRLLLYNVDNRTSRKLNLVGEYPSLLAAMCRAYESVGQPCDDWWHIYVAQPEPF